MMHLSGTTGSSRRTPGCRGPEDGRSPHAATRDAMSSGDEALPGWRCSSSLKGAGGTVKFNPVMMHLSGTTGSSRRTPGCRGPEDGRSPHAATRDAMSSGDEALPGWRCSSSLKGAGGTVKFNPVMMHLSGTTGSSRRTPGCRGPEDGRSPHAATRDAMSSGDEALPTRTTNCHLSLSKSFLNC
ncbi:apomucin-like isoform X2 [Pseudoliparis swirei]|nr:apomucin-like isoform X2 [Pseudoliparis swirei]